MDFIDFIRSFNIVTILVRLLLSAACGGLIGLEREKSGRAAGFRTHILVCVGAAMTSLIGHYAMTCLDGYDGDPMRVSAQVISGIGFLGVGTILSKGRFQVTGLTTAAGLWATSAIGLAYGFGFYEGGIIGTALILIAMIALSRLDVHMISKNRKVHIYMEVTEKENIPVVLKFLNETYSSEEIMVTPARSGINGSAGIEATFKLAQDETRDMLIDSLTSHPEVLFAISSI